MIQVASKQKKPENILKEFPNSILADVTSNATDGLRKLSPFFPHYDIPIPFTKGMTATCVEAIWQGLKVFETADVDVSPVSYTHLTLPTTEPVCRSRWSPYH